MPRGLATAIIPGAFAALLVTGGAAPAPAQELLFLAPGDVDIYGLGLAIEPLGDVDGDGHPDFVAAGLGVHVPVDYRVSVFSGRDGSLLHGFTRPPGTGTGRRLASLGDLDGDGVADYAAADPFIDGVFVRSGVDGSRLFTYIEPTLGMFGGAVGGIGDLDGDSIPELVVGSPGEIDPGDGDRNVIGRVGVYSGFDRTLLFDFSGTTGEYTYGWDVASPDVDSDGTPDIVVGSPNDGRIEAYSGATGLLLFQVTKKRLFGTSIARAGDADLDGHEDFLVGAPSRRDWDRVGRAFLISGADGGTLYTWRGDVGEQYGQTVAGAGDVDADGRADFLVGSMGYGSARRRPVLLSGVDGKELYAFDSPREGLTSLGSAVAGPGDLDRDGLCDLLVGDRAFDAHGGVARGAVLAFSGNDLFLDADPRTVAGGQSLSLTLGQGPARQPSLIVLVEIDGSRCSCALFGVAPLDDAGRRRIQVTTDPALAGMSFRLQAFVLDSSGRMQDTARETVAVE